MDVSKVTIEPTETKKAASGAKVSLGLLLAINLFNYIDRQVLAAVEPEVAKEFFGAEHSTAATLTKMGFLSTAFLVSYMVSAPIFGWLADRMSRWLLVGLGVILWSLATAGSGLATGFAMLLIMRLFVGVGEAGYGPSAPTLIADLFPVSRRGRALSWFYLAIPVGSALGYVIGGVVSHAIGWREAFYIVTLPGLALGAGALFMRDPVRGGMDGGKPVVKATRADYLQLLRNRSYVLNTLAGTAMTFAIGGIGFWIPRYLTEVRDQPNSAKTMFGAVTVVSGLGATLIGGWAGDKLRSRVRGAYFMVSGFSLLLACPFVVLMLWLPFPLAWGALFCAVFFLFFNTGPSNTAVANVTSPNLRATAFAINIFVIHALGDAISPPFLGYVGGRFGWNGAFYVVAGAMAVGGLIWVFAARFLDQDTARASGVETGLTTKLHDQA